MIYDIGIIGAGASGMMAAVAAYREGLRICLFEHNDKPGKKILVTGNGKCNITNLNMTPECYNSNSDGSYFSVIKNFGPSELISFFKKIGLYTRDKDGYIYPFSEQAVSVLDALKNEISRLRIDLFTGINIKEIKKGFVIFSDKGEFNVRKLIIACGSKAMPVTGSDGSGYDFAKKFSHHIVDVIPALVQIKCREKFFKELAGIRTKATVTVTDKAVKVVGDSGELQLTEYGISGIPVFQVSRHIKRLSDKGNDVKVHINFMPGYSTKTVKGMVHNIFSHNCKLDPVTALNGLLNKKLALVLVKNTTIDRGKSCGEITETQTEELVRNIIDFTVTPYDTNGFDNAQVCAGGVNLDEINLNTMESRLVKNLYFAGEILDVDGKCGGYNLQWAFSSGYLAGISAGKE